MRSRLLGLLFIAGCTTSLGPTVQPTVAGQAGEREVCKPLNAKSSVVHCTPAPVAEGVAGR
jgi:hypothetical protein